ncbi:hypothetical protein CPB86DRAFT_778536 [Serendipita vermifera]|nr:hypothetical protein CPB86DRAFT_778536 [Serendipita vermifera]
MTVTNGIIQFSNQARHWLSCLTQPDRYTVGELAEHLELIRTSVQANHSSIHKVSNQWHTYNRKNIQLEVDIKQTKESLKTEEKSRRDQRNKQENLAGASIASVLGTAILGIFVPPTLLVTVPASAGLIGVCAANSGTSINDQNALISTLENTSTRLTEAQKQLEWLTVGTQTLTKWWDEMEQTLFNLKDEAVSLDAQNIRHLSVSIDAAREQLAKVHEGFSKYKGEIRILQDYFPAHLQPALV